MSTRSAGSGSSGEGDPHTGGYTDGGASWQSEYEAPTPTGDPQETGFPSDGLLLLPLPFTSDESSFSSSFSTDSSSLSALASQQGNESPDSDPSRTLVTPHYMVNVMKSRKKRGQ